MAEALATAEWEMEPVADGISRIVISLTYEAEQVMNKLTFYSQTNSILQQ